MRRRIVFGQAGEDEFSDDVVARPEVIALRDRMHATVDDASDEAAADVSRDLHRWPFAATLRRACDRQPQRPMSDADLARKFRALADPVLGGSRAERLLAECENFAAAPDLRAFAAAASAPPA